MLVTLVSSTHTYQMQVLICTWANLRINLRKNVRAKKNLSKRIFAENVIGATILQKMHNIGTNKHFFAETMTLENEKHTWYTNLCYLVT